MNQLSLQNIVSYFANIATNHDQIQSFYYGPKWDVNVGQYILKNGKISNEAIYPIMVVIPQKSKVRKDSMVLIHTIQIIDQIQADASNRIELLSDNLQTLLDVKAYIWKDFSVLGEDIFPTEESDIEPLYENYDDILAGWSMDVELQLDWLAEVCSIPGLVPSAVTFNQSGSFVSINLANYLPLTGGALSGNLSGTTVYMNDYFSGGTELITIIQNLAAADIFTGGTVTGPTNFLNGLTSTTVSATTYLNLPTDIRVTGGTYNQGTSTAIFTNNTGGTFTVTGITTSSQFTGGTVTGATNFTGGLTANTISATTYLNLPITIDTFVTGFTYNNNVATINQNQGQSPLSILINTMTGLTVNGNLSATTVSSATITANKLFATGLTTTTLSASTYQGLPVTADTFVTSFTYDGLDNLTIGQNQGQPNLSVLLNTFSAITVNGRTTVNDGLFVTGTTTTNLITTSGITDSGNLNISGATTISGFINTGGTTNMVTATSGGTLSANTPVISAYGVPSSAQTQLSINTNWDINGNYIGASAITGTYQGQLYYDQNYLYEAIADNIFIRLLRNTASLSALTFTANTISATSITASTKILLGPANGTYGFMDIVDMENTANTTYDGLGVFNNNNSGTKAPLVLVGFGNSGSFLGTNSFNGGFGYVAAANNFATGSVANDLVFGNFGIGTGKGGLMFVTNDVNAGYIDTNQKWKIPTLSSTTFTGTSILGSTVSASTISGDTFISGGTNLLNIFLPNTGWSAFTPALTGFSVSSILQYQYTVIGKTCFIELFISGTSTGTSFNMTLPFTANTYAWGSGFAQNTGGNSQAYISTYPNNQSNVANVLISSGGNGWPSSGTKQLYGSFFYQTI